MSHQTSTRVEDVLTCCPPGPPERDAHPGVEDRFNSIPNQLAPIFKNGSISIYEVR